MNWNAFYQAVKHGDFFPLPDRAATLEPPCRRQQEEQFARVLARCANQIESKNGPTWAVETLRRLAETRGLGDSTATKDAWARVVFGWEGDVPTAFRPGLVVP